MALRTNANGVRIRRTLSLANAQQIQEYEAKERSLAPDLP